MGGAREEERRGEEREGISSGRARAREDRGCGIPFRSHSSIQARMAMAMAMAMFGSHSALALVRRQTLVRIKLWEGEGDINKVALSLLRVNSSSSTVRY